MNCEVMNRKSLQSFIMSHPGNYGGYAVAGETPLPVEGLAELALVIVRATDNPGNAEALHILSAFLHFAEDALHFDARGPAFWAIIRGRTLRGALHREFPPPVMVPLYIPDAPEIFAAVVVPTPPPVVAVPDEVDAGVIPAAEPLPVGNPLPVADLLPVADPLPDADLLPIADPLPDADLLPIADPLPIPFLEEEDADFLEIEISADEVAAILAEMD